MPPTFPSSPTSSPLPKPSTFLTDILATLSSLPKPPLEADSTSVKIASLAKPYLLTLHAIFPSTLLPALDLLDRHLVTRHILAQQSETAKIPSNVPLPTNSVTAPQPTDGGNSTGHETRNMNIDISPNLPGPESNLQTNEGPGSLAPLMDPPPNQPSTSRRQTYYVRSSQPQHSVKQRRFGGYNAGTGGMYDFDKSYEVRPWAWSCTCAAFAFAAYNHPSGDDFGNDDCGNDDHQDETEFWGERDAVRESSSRDRIRGEEEQLEAEDSMEGEEAEGSGWGGLMGIYRDQTQSGNVPLCKHLLACVLAEWWDEAQGLVDVKVVGREEMAGWAAGWGG